MEIERAWPACPPEALDGARAFLAARFPRALLALADCTPALRDAAEVWVAQPAALAGVGVVFRGFRTPVVSVVADDAGSAAALLARIRSVVALPFLLAAHEHEPVLGAVSLAGAGTDVWLAGETAGVDPDPGVRVEHVEDADEVAAFYRQARVEFWTTAMLRFGHHYGVRGPGGVLACLVGVNFIVPGCGYAQLGNLATTPAFRGRGLARATLSAAVAGLAAAGIPRWGLFVDAGRGDLHRFYQSFGLSEAGHFVFVPLRADPS